jgi:hypothetical protein
MLNKILILIIAAMFFPGKGINAQTQAIPKWRVSAGMGQYSAKIGLPDWTAIHPGFMAGASYLFNRSEHHQLRQSVWLSSIYHAHFQSAIQLYTEFQYEWHIGRKFYISPLALGGGYVASFSDMPGHVWDGSAYVPENISLKNNFVISMGPNLGYHTPWSLYGHPLSFFLGYRLQVQGIIVTSTVPFMAYSSWQFGAGLSF